MQFYIDKEGPVNKPGPLCFLQKMAKIREILLYLPSFL